MSDITYPNNDKNVTFWKLFNVTLQQGNLFQSVYFCVQKVSVLSLKPLKLSKEQGILPFVKLLKQFCFPFSLFSPARRLHVGDNSEHVHLTSLINS